MAAIDSSCFPVKGQAYRVEAKIVSSATANPITGGLTDLTAQVSKDGGNWANTTNSAVEIQTSGYAYVDLTSTEMNADSILVKFTASNSNAVEQSLVIKPVDLTENTDHWRDSAVLRLEQAWTWLSAYLLNKQSRNKATGLQTLYKADSATEMATMSFEDDGTNEVKGKLGG